MSAAAGWDEPLRRVRIGRGLVARAHELVAEAGLAPYALLTTPRAAAAAPALVAGAAAVAHVQAGAVPDVAAAVHDAVRGLPLVALGGGRVIDAAKAIAQVDGVPVAAVPTTLAGSPLTRSGRPLDLAAHGERVPPRLAIIDPDLLATAPPALLAATALNSLAHAAESLYHPRATPLTHAVGMRGAGLLAGGSERSDLDDLALGGALAAWSLDLTGLLVHHAVCQSIVRTAGTPHALTNATLLPRTLALVEQRAPGALRLLATALGEPDAIGALERIRRLGARAGASGLAALGVTPAHVDAIADAAAGRSELAAMPGGAPSVAELRALVGGALDG